MNYTNTPAKNVLAQLNTSSKGLSNEEAQRRLAQYGRNELKTKDKNPPWIILLRQFSNFLVIILIVAVILSGMIGEWEDAIVILIILVINAVVGFIQEYNAERAMEALKKIASLKAIVIRDGKEMEIEAALIVPGDLILVETGQKIPGDARILDHHNLSTMEAPLTGESTPVEKTAEALKGNLIISDQKNMIFSSTTVTSGRCTAIVVATGMQTEIGKIAMMLQEQVEPLTPLQKSLGRMSKIIGLGVIGICAVFFASVLARRGIALLSTEALFTFRDAVALAVAAIPEGLPIIVTIALALGVKRMVKRNALIRTLPSVETLGATTVICTDKTGTLTHNEMTVKKLFMNGKTVDVTGSGYSAEGTFLLGTKSVASKDLELLLTAGSLCTDGKLEDGKPFGDPTEVALIVAAMKLGLKKEALEERMPRVDEIDFTSERKMMSTLHKKGKSKVMFTKGAPDILLKKCTKIWTAGKVRKLTPKDKKAILAANEQYAKQALRVLGFAYKDTKKEFRENGLVFIGLQGMIDPPRAEVKEAIQKCNEAGIRVVMITGDHKITALAIAAQLGITGKAITGEELEKLDLDREVEHIAIYARVNPEHKLRIVDALKKKGHIVAMTGDGINDAPALKKADIGVAMGITGTDVAKEASNMVLTDDNFSSIVNAVEEGRSVYDNIRKSMECLLSSNLAEVLVVFLGVMLGLPLPILAIQLLWINLATDGLPALSLAVEPAEPDIMKRKPRNPKQGILTRFVMLRMLSIGIIMMIGTLGLYAFILRVGGQFPGTTLDSESYLYMYATTMAFTTLMMFQMFNVLNCRSEKHLLYKLGFWSNPRMLLAIGVSIILQVIVLYTPLRSWFKTVPLTMSDWILIIIISCSVLVIGELMKFIRNKIHYEIT